ncbi:MAG TPA: phosphoribosylglycinamide formyltransferase [Patescibacteria group bacterium]
MMNRKARIVVLISGRGSNMVAIADNIDAGLIPDAEIVLVLSNKDDAPGLQIARERGLHTWFIRASSSFLERKLTREEYDEQLKGVLADYEPDLICLAGFMRILSPGFVQEYQNRILNIHPSLLPAFPGEDAHTDVLAYGAKVSGCTIHMVDEQVDHGPIVVQRTVPVHESDTKKTLADRVLVEEHIAYTEAINMVLSGNFEVVGRRFQLKEL